ncbi:MAG: hypothetical protein KA717_06015 [Woronichinia naegeliana WA131]|uniref:Uncharacterized protein n=1 Tax=Woronichinia naegeliana WA131 TaxID=2824559 RepID=A0A977PYD1_9CYAN|nr:MAG: hypothetical protein KA717_06015 [Woronichinia naegeliana WA131]
MTRHTTNCVIASTTSKTIYASTTGNKVIAIINFDPPNRHLKTWVTRMV